ncbi:hypothetical protein F52700_5836 [Fusarium sp. NRRL 52700]|nr:hypothetical protein F52700_5836 [Fusarium sp. NRRL 52700]
MAIISNNTPSAEGHTSPLPDVFGAQKPVQSSPSETKTDDSTESAVWHLEATWGNEAIDVSLKVGAAGLALILALALLALAVLTKAVISTTFLSLLDLIEGTMLVVTMVMTLVLLSVVAFKILSDHLGDISGSADVRSGN